MNKEPKVEQAPSGVRLDTGTSSTRAYDRRPGKLATKSKNGTKTAKDSSRQSVFALAPSQSRVDRKELEKYIEDGKRPVYGFPHLCFDEQMLLHD